MSGHGPSPAHRRVRRTAFGLLLASSALTAPAAFAQVTPTTAAVSAGGGQSNTAGQPAESVVVTGSRLQISNATSAAPITVITSKEIANSSAQTVEDVLKNIPSIGSEGNYATTNNGGNGSSCIDIRNLGINRTLVLVDGRRYVHSGYGTGYDCVDLDTIPIAMVDRIEILKNGASTIYGADAVAGVVNIITKKNYRGATLQLGGEDTQYGDDLKGEISGLAGFDFLQGRGNFTLSGRYLDQGPVYQRDRPWADPVVAADNGPGQPYTIGSGIPVAGRYFGATTGSDNQVINGKLVPYQNTYNGAGINPNIPGRYDYGALSQLSDRKKEGNLAGNTHIDINDHLTLYASAFYTHKETEEQLSGQPLTSNPNTGQSFDIPQGNPFAESLGIDEDLNAYRRVSDWGPRDYITSLDAYQFTVGARGDLIGRWRYDTYYTYGSSINTLHYTNQVQWSHLEQEVGFQGTDPAAVDTGIYNPAVCSQVAGCVLANPFGAGGFSQQAINYASFTSTSTSYYQFRDIGASITNNHLLQLPYGPLGLAFGLEHRGEQGAYHPDAIIQSGDSAASAEQPTGGGFDVTELYGELSIPILKNLPFAKDLSGTMSGRWSDYSTFGGVQNFQLEGNWSPTKDIRFRASLGSSVRQPAIQEAFGGQTTSFETAIDPCAQASSYGGRAGIVAANCAAQGVNVNTFTQPGTQISTIVGGNPQLQPESSRTYTIGTVITPRWTPHLSAEIDYWHTKIENQIGSIETQQIVDNCYTSPGFSSSYCGDIGPRTATQQINQVIGTTTNLGETRTNGIDFDLSYLVPLGHRQSISLVNELTDLIGYVTQTQADGPFINLKGRLSPLITSLYPAGYPVIRDNATVTYNNHGFSFSWTVRYIDSMLYNNGSVDLDAADYRFYHTNEVFYHDIVASYDWKRFGVIFGIDNLFNKDPLFALDASTNTASSVYDVYGRLFYAKFQVKF